MQNHLHSLVIKESTFPGKKGKRPASATNVMNNNASKKGRGGGGLPNQLVNRAFQGLSYGQGRSGARGRGRV
ncbi:Apoptosis inhibitor 5-like protein API5 [Camellia lanceoleosa]|uniref:Apoptosis inhibitor 5-like protein API5 n=1 Tax=Camellia lanceoleosa TaxID=1840588 RepID=A0ACC0GKH9_9ERIC|nr:Apoptosis inhibitor 5-like protein API5 [Camellia lanceoleosa]